MKRFITLMLFMSTVASAQTEYNFGNAITWRQSMVSVALPDSISVRTLSMLGRLDIAPATEISGILPSEYNWKRAARYTDSVKKVALGYHRLDAYGREILPDMVTELSMRVASRNILFNF